MFKVNELKNSDLVTHSRFRPKFCVDLVKITQGSKVDNRKAVMQGPDSTRESCICYSSTDTI